MSESRTVVISGATGLVGSALARAYEAEGVRVVRLVRREAVGPDEAAWDPVAGSIDAGKLEGVDAVVHLAGENLAKQRWTAELKQRIRASRVQGTELIAQTVANLNHKPRVLVSASAIGFYGNRPGEVLTDESPPGSGFLAETCQQWEAACRPAWMAGIRVAQLRIGVVLSPEGGALKKMVPLFRWGLGGPLGRGNQLVSWIALPDLVRAIRHVVDHNTMHGAVNCTSPNPVTNGQFASALGRALRRPAILPTPAAALRLVVGEAAGPLLLEGADICPQRLLDTGFEFETPHIAAALDRVLASQA